MGGARDQRTAGGGVLQPQGLNEAGGVASGCRLLHSMGPCDRGGIFCVRGGPCIGRFGGPPAQANLAEPADDEPPHQVPCARRKHRSFTTRTGVPSGVDRVAAAASASSLNSCHDFRSLNLPMRARSNHSLIRWAGSRWQQAFWWR